MRPFIDGSWLGGHLINRTDTLAAMISNTLDLATEEKRSEINAEKKANVWTEFSRLLVGVEHIAKAKTVFKFKNEREYENVYNQAFRDRLNI